MTPRQQRMLDAIRECLLRQAAWEPLHYAQGAYARATAECSASLSSPFVDAVAKAEARARCQTTQEELSLAERAYCDERARQLPGVIEEVLREEGEERDAAVRALLEAATAHLPRCDGACCAPPYPPEDGCEQCVDLRAAIAEVREHYPEGGQSATRTACRVYCEAPGCVDMLRLSEHDFAGFRANGYLSVGGEEWTWGMADGPGRNGVRCPAHSDVNVEDGNPLHALNLRGGQ